MKEHTIRVMEPKDCILGSLVTLLDHIDAVKYSDDRFIIKDSPGNPELVVLGVMSDYENILLTVVSQIAVQREELLKEYTCKDTDSDQLVYNGLDNFQDDFFCRLDKAVDSLLILSGMIESNIRQRYSLEVIKYQEEIGPESDLKISFKLITNNIIVIVFILKDDPPVMF